MPITTAEQVITGEWVQVSTGDCTMQTARAGVVYDISVGEATPTVGLALKLDRPITFAYKAPVWVRLNAKGNATVQRSIHIIK